MTHHADKGTEQQREHAVACPWHPRTRPVLTWHHSGECDDCRATLAAAAVLVSSAGVEFAS